MKNMMMCLSNFFHNYDYIHHLTTGSLICKYNIPSAKHQKTPGKCYHYELDQQVEVEDKLVSSPEKKTLFEVLNQVRHEPFCLATEPG